MQTHKNVKAMEALLEREYDAILRADFSGLTGLIEEKQHLLAVIEDAPGITVEALKPLKGAAARNDLCLKAAMRGVAAARFRLAELRDARDGLSTYDSQGRKASAQTLPDQLEHRA